MYLMCSYFEWYIIAHFAVVNELVTSHIFNRGVHEYSNFRIFEL